MFCMHCGKENPDDYRFCIGCGKSLKYDDAAQEASSATKPEESGPGRIASLGNRLIAMILDSILFMAVFAATGMFVAVRMGGVTGSGFSMQGEPALITMFLTSILAFLYFWVMEGMFGGTLGKKLIGIEVTDLEGRRCGMKRSLIRNLLRIVDGLCVYLVGFLIALFSKRRQRLGDRIAGTVVIEKSPVKRTRIIMIVLWFGLIIAGIALAVATHQMSGSQLKIANLTFLESKGGPVRASSTYKPGEQLFSTYTITGFSTDSQGLAHLQILVTVSDPSKLTMLQWSGNFDKKPEKEAPVDGWINFRLVPFVSPGRHSINIRVLDLIKNTTAEFVAAFNVEAPHPVVSTRLELRDMQMSAAEGGPVLSPAAVMRGQTLYTTAKLSGVQFREKAVSVRIAFQLLDPNGNILINRPDFISVNEAFEYRPPGFYIPFSARVTLPPAGPQGTYMQKFTATDLNANVAVTYTSRVTAQ